MDACPHMSKPRLFVPSASSVSWQFGLGMHLFREAERGDKGDSKSPYSLKKFASYGKGKCLVRKPPVSRKPEPKPAFKFVERLPPSFGIPKAEARRLWHAKALGRHGGQPGKESFVKRNPSHVRVSATKISNLGSVPRSGHKDHLRSKLSLVSRNAKSASRILESEQIQVNHKWRVAKGGSWGRLLSRAYHLGGRSAVISLWKGVPEYAPPKREVPVESESSMTQGLLREQERHFDNILCNPSRFPEKWGLTYLDLLEDKYGIKVIFKERFRSALQALESFPPDLVKMMLKPPGKNDTFFADTQFAGIFKVVKDRPG